jgi:DNA-directed RNA polymerase subunit RPC12/RpoP
MKQKENCDICYKIICRQCGWEADDDAVLKIQKGEITACPECGWKPH